MVAATMRCRIIRSMPIKENLQLLMEMAGHNPHSLARETGVKQPTIFRILEGESTTPRDGTIRPLAEYFGISIEDLRYADLRRSDRSGLIVEPPAGRSNVEDAPGQYGHRVAPVISWVQAGEWSEAVDLHHPGQGDSYEPIPDTAGAHVFWLRVVGDSMTSQAGVSVPEGHLILVDPDVEPMNGSLVVAKLEDSQEVTFKKLVIDAGQKYLKPLNPNYKTTPINGNCRIVGVGIEAKIKV